METILVRIVAVLLFWGLLYLTCRGMLRYHKREGKKREKIKNIFDV